MTEYLAAHASRYGGRKAIGAALLTVRLDDVHSCRDGNATHEQAAHHGCMPLTGRRTA